MTYRCCNENRKAAVLNNPGLKMNGIDYLEVLDSAAVPLGLPRQQTLLIHCLSAAPATLQPDNIMITGGESITGITAAWIAVATSAGARRPSEGILFNSLPDAANVSGRGTERSGRFFALYLRLVNDITQASADPFEMTEVLTGFDSATGRSRILI